MLLNSTVNSNSWLSLHPMTTGSFPFYLFQNEKKKNNLKIKPKQLTGMFPWLLCGSGVGLEGHAWLLT